MMYERTPPGCFEHPVMVTLFDYTELLLEKVFRASEFKCPPLLRLYQKYGSEGFAKKYSYWCKCKDYEGDLGTAIKLTTKNGLVFEGFSTREDHVSTFRRFFEAIYDTILQTEEDIQSGKPEEEILKSLTDLFNGAFSHDVH